MQKLNSKIFIGLLATILTIVVIIIFFFVRSSENNNQVTDTQLKQPDESLLEIGIRNENTEKVFSFINPYSKSGEIEYLSPLKDDISDNAGSRLDEKVLYVRTLDLKTGDINATEVEIRSPKKVVWGQSGSIIYLSTQGTAFLYGKDRSQQTEIATNATDVSLSDESNLVSVTTKNAISIFALEPKISLLMSAETIGSLNQSLATDDGVIYKSKSGWESYNAKTKKIMALDIEGENISHYSSGNNIIFSSEENSSLYNPTTESRTIIDGIVRPSIVIESDNGIIFTIIRAGQSEDQTSLLCINKVSGEQIKLYQPSVEAESFDASSGLMRGDQFYFTWGFDLSSLKIDKSMLKKCSQ